MTARTVEFAFGFGLVLFLCTAGAVPNRAKDTDLDKWMLEVTGWYATPIYLRTYLHSSLTLSGAHQAAPDRGALTGAKPSSVRLQYDVEGDGLRIRVLLFFGEFPRAAQVSVGTYLVRPNQPAVLSELSRFGLTPLKARLVDAHPPQVVLPEIVNKTGSLVVEKVDEDRLDYELLVRNTAPSAVEDLVATIRQGDKSAGGRQRGGMLMAPLIPPGGLYKLFLPRQPSDPLQPPQVAIEAAIFEDGTYEGDEQEGAAVEAERLGRRARRQRLVNIVQGALLNLEASGSSTLTLIETNASKLPDDPEPAMIEAVMAQFPALAETARSKVESGLRDGLQEEKQFFLSDLKGYEVSNGRRRGLSVREWWDAERRRFGEGER